MNRITTGAFLAALITATAAGAQNRAADGGVNATSHEAHDTLSAQDQAAARAPSRSDSFWYARLGYGGVFGDSFTGGPALGFGFRAGFDSYGIDVSFLNFKVPSSGSDILYGSQASSLAGSLLKLEGLYFLKPKPRATAYLGGGFSYGGTDVGGAYGTNNIQTSWHGSGLQGELTAGYEWPRANALRMFVQADATLPFYNVTSEQITFSDRPFGGFTSTTDHRYSASLVVSVGLGWQRGRHARP